MPPFRLDRTIVRRQGTPGSNVPTATAPAFSGTVLGAALGGVAAVIILMVLIAKRRQLWARLHGQRWTSAPTSTTLSDVPLTATTSQNGSVTITNGHGSGAGTPRTGRRPYGRRQDSGRSISSVPEYRLDAADEELVLVKPRDENDLADIPLESPRPSVDVSSEDTHIMTEIGASGSNMHLPLLQPPSYSPHMGRSRSSSAPRTPDLDATDTTSPLTLSTSRLTGNSSTASLALPSHRASSSTDQLPPSSRRTRVRESFYNLGGRQSTSRRSVSGHPGENPSSSSLVISDPLPSTFARSEYVYPRSGMTPAQMSFISSRESLSRLGVYPSVGGAEPPAFESPTDGSFAASLPPPIATSTSSALSPIPPSPTVSSPVEDPARSASLRSAREELPPTALEDRRGVERSDTIQSMASFATARESVR